MSEALSPIEIPDEPDFAEVTEQSFSDFKELAERYQSDPNGIFQEVVSSWLERKFFNIDADLNNGEEIGVASMTNRNFARLFSAMLLAAEKENSSDDSRIKYPFENMFVLELGAYDADSGDGWYCAEAYNRDGFDYTGVDRRASSGTDVGHRDEKTGKLQELLDIDAVDLGEALPGRQFQLVFGIRFLGYPTNGKAEKILETVSQRMVSGGVAFFMNERNESIRLRSEYVDELGLEMIETSCAHRPIYVFRKK
jgi:hypothetical protein